VKGRIPWPLKVLIKLGLGVARVDYPRLKRLGIVEFGRMEDPAFARAVFDLHVLGPMREFGLPAHGALLELGPGDSVATGALGRRAGFTEVQLLDAGAFADLRAASVKRLFASLGVDAPALPEEASRAPLLAALDELGIHYRADGVRAFESIIAGSVGYSFSNTVLQHVIRAELPGLFGQLARVHAPGSMGSHLVNFADHFSGGFLHQALPDWLMESNAIKRAHLYTNRFSPEQILRLFEECGFTLERLTVDYFDAIAPAQETFASAAEFLARSSQRRVLRAVYLIRKS